MVKSKINYFIKVAVMLIIAITLSVMLVACGEKSEKDMKETLEKATENFLNYNGSYEITITQASNEILEQEKSSSDITKSTYNAKTGEMTIVTESDNQILSKTSVMQVGEQFYNLTETYSYDETTGELIDTKYDAKLVGEDYAKHANLFAGLIDSGEIEMIIGSLDTSALAEYYNIMRDKFSEAKKGYKYEVELTEKSGHFNSLSGEYTRRATSKFALLLEFNDKLITKMKYSNSSVANVFGGKGTGIADGKYSESSYVMIDFNNKYNANLAIKDTTNYDLENAPNIGISVTYYGDESLKHINAKYGDNVELLKNFDSQLKQGSQSDNKWYVDEKCTTEFTSETWPSYSLILYTKVTPKEDYAKIEQESNYGIYKSTKLKYFNVSSGDKYNISSTVSSSYKFVSATINGVKTTEVEQTLEAGKSYVIVANFEEKEQKVKAKVTKAQEKQFNAVIDNLVALYGTKNSYTVTYESNESTNKNKFIESYDAVNKKLVIVSEYRSADNTLINGYKMMYDFNNNKIVSKRINNDSTTQDQTANYNSYFKIETPFAQLLKEYDDYHSIQDMVDDINSSAGLITSIITNLTNNSLQVKVNFENGYVDNTIEFDGKNQVTKITQHSVTTGESANDATNTYSVSYNFDSTLWQNIE